MPKKETKSIIGLLQEHEEAIAELYKTFAQKYPEYKRFWMTMSFEERVHASWIRKIRPMVRNGKVRLNESRFKAIILKRSLRHVSQVKKLFQKRKTMTIAQAMSAALAIENFPMESKFFQVYTSDSRDLILLLRSLRDAFAEHRGRLLDALDKLNYIEDITHA
jgi:hypothetical protein